MVWFFGSGFEGFSGSGFVGFSDQDLKAFQDQDLKVFQDQDLSVWFLKEWIRYWIWTFGFSELDIDVLLIQRCKIQAAKGNLFD